MNKLRPLALLCAGPVSRSSLARLPHLRRNLAWVKSNSYSVACRAVNALGAGSAVNEITEMTRAGTWVLSVPGEDLPGAVDQLCAAGIDWHRRIVLILDRDMESEQAEPLRAMGASVASFAPVDSEASRYVVEGDPDAVRAVRSLIGDAHKRLVLEIKRGAKASYVAGARAATKQVLPLIAEAVESFQSAGLSNPDAKSLAESLVNGAMRSYFRAGRRAIKPS